MLQGALATHHKAAPRTCTGNSAKSLSGAWFICGALFFILLLSPAILAQPINARLSVVSLTPPRVRVEAERVGGTKVWSFRNAYAGIIGLGERIENLILYDVQGGEVAGRKLAQG